MTSYANHPNSTGIYQLLHYHGKDIPLWDDVFLTLDNYGRNEEVDRVWHESESIIEIKGYSYLWDCLRGEINEQYKGHNIEGSIIALDAAKALIAYDNCTHLLNSESSEVKLLGRLGNDAAMMLWASALVIRAIKEKYGE